MPVGCLGDPNTGLGFIMTANPRFISGGRPVACIGDVITPHDFRPVHFAVVATGNPRYIAGGRPVTSFADIDSCLHMRLGGNGRHLG